MEELDLVKRSFCVSRSGFHDLEGDMSIQPARPISIAALEVTAARDLYGSSFPAKAAAAYARLGTAARCCI